MSAQGFLDKADLRRLCGGKARANAQEAFLKAKAIPYKREGNDITVMWVHVQAYHEGTHRPRSQGINWAAV